MASHLFKTIILSSCGERLSANCGLFPKPVSLKQAKPVFRLLVQLSLSPPDIPTNSWIDVVTTSTAFLVREKDVISSLSETEYKTLLFLITRLSHNIATKSMFDVQEENPFYTHPFNPPPFFTCRQMMLCGFLCLWQLRGLCLTKTERDDVYLYLNRFAREIKTPYPTISLLNVLLDLNNITSIGAHGTTYHTKSLTRCVVPIPESKTNIYLFIPRHEYILWVISIGKGDPHYFTESGYTLLDWLFDWYDPRRKFLPLNCNKKEFLEIITFLSKIGVKSMQDPKVVIQTIS